VDTPVQNSNNKKWYKKLQVGSPVNTAYSPANTAYSPSNTNYSPVSTKHDSPQLSS